MPLIAGPQQPAQWILEADGIFVVTAADAARQDIRPLRILLIDLMPEAIGLRVQLKRLLGNTPLQIELTVLSLEDGVAVEDGGPRSFGEIAGARFDGLVVSHCDAGDRAVHQVPCWDELRDVLDWSQDHVHAALFLGWSAFAALDHFYAIPAVPTAQPLLGLHHHRLPRRQSYLLRGSDDGFDVPVSRQHTVDAAALAGSPWLEVLAEAPASGPYLVRNRSRRQVFVTNLPHYEPGHLLLDQRRAGIAVGTQVPPACTWRSHAQLLFANWLNYYVYQASPYHLEQLTPMASPTRIRSPLPGLRRKEGPAPG
jgi:homoserine O-succinyltransferase